MPVVGAVPEPPPTTKALATSGAEFESAMLLEKYGIPPLVPLVGY